MLMREIYAVGLVIISVSCQREPPKVALHGPKEAEAGQKAELSAEVSPWQEDMRLSWKTKWFRTGPGQKECDVVIEADGEKRAKIVVPDDCEAGKVLVEAKVSGRGPEAKASLEIRLKPAEGPVWPAQVPSTWVIVNDYGIGHSKVNEFGGAWGSWGFRGGKCRLEVAEGALRIAYSLPLKDSECGTFEYFKGAAGKPEAFDINPYEKVAVLMRSGDGRQHRVMLEVVELDPYAEALQGYVSSGPLWTLDNDWKRYEARLNDILHPRFNRKMGKQLGLRVRRQDQDSENGVIWVDKLTLIRKESK